MTHKNILSDWGKTVKIDNLQYAFEWNKNNISKVNDRDVESFIQAIIFNNISYFFKDHPVALIEFKRLLIQNLGLSLLENSDEVFLTGSSQFGFSLAPKKFLKPFSGSSDIDCFIISSKLFMQLEEALDMWNIDRTEFNQAAYDDSKRNGRSGFFQSHLLPNRYKVVSRLLLSEREALVFINNFLKTYFPDHPKIKKLSIRIYKNKVSAMSQIKQNIQSAIRETIRN